MSALPKQDLSPRFRSFKDAYSQEDKAYEVTIENDHGTVDVDYVILTHGDQDHERVKWVNNAQHQVSIVFYSADGSPFDSPIFQVGPGGSETSGPISPRVHDYKGYRYAVVGSKGSTDPTVIIDR
jgi:hypothetical protein